MRLKRVDLPALVYPTSETVGTSALIRDCRPCSRCFSTLSGRDCICTMRLRNKRRSVSSWVSPGPRKPIPPFCLSKVGPATHPARSQMAQLRQRSTCNLPSWVRARWAKISKIRPVRSITRHSHKRSELRSCAGLRAWSKRTTEAPVVLTASAISTALPSPTKYFWVRRFTATGNHLQCFDTGGRDQRFKLRRSSHIFVLRKIDVITSTACSPASVTVKQAYNPLNGSAGNAGSLAPV